MAVLYFHEDIIISFSFAFHQEKDMIKSFEDVIKGVGISKISRLLLKIDHNEIESY